MDRNFKTNHSSKLHKLECFGNSREGLEVSQLCETCALQGVCRMRYVKALSNSETEDTSIVWHIRKLGFDLVTKANITPTELPDWLTTEHALMSTIPVDGFNNSLVLKTKLLSPPDSEIDRDGAKVWNERRRDYYRRTWFASPPNYVMPVEDAYRDLFKLCGTLFMCIAPKVAITIPRHFGAVNQSNFELPQPANDNSN